MRRHVVSLVVSSLVVVAWFGATLGVGWRPLLGLDLQGGISVVLFPVEGTDQDTLDTAVDIIRNRVDALGVVEPDVSRQGNTIVVDLPGVDDPDQALELIGRTAQLRFRLVCGELAPFDEDAPPADPAAAFANPIPECQPTGIPEPAPPAPPGAPEGEVPEPETVPGDDVPGGEAPEPGGEPQAVGARAVTALPIAASRPAQEGEGPGADEAPTDEVPPDEAPTDEVPPDEVPPDAFGGGVPTTEREDDVDDAFVILPAEPVDDDVAFRYALSPALLTGEEVSSARAQFAESRWLVEVTFRSDAFVERIARPHVDQRVAIVLDGQVISAPVINPGITGRDVTITGQFTEREARDLALVLRYGALPVQFDDDERTVQNVSPTLGSDQLRAGIIAGAVGLALVALYTIIYYRLLALVVWYGLALTGLVFYALVSLLSERFGLTLTLAGVTGLIVAIGVTVDSYIVYFERLKDEVRSGKTVRSSIDTGFRKAFRTIIAADIVALISSGILYLLAAGAVRGFAFFLGLSALIDLVVSYFVMYPLTAILARNPSLVRARGVGVGAGLDLQRAEL